MEFDSSDTGAVAEAILGTAEAAVLAGHPESAVAELRRGLVLGRRWLDSGETLAGRALLTTLGQKLGATLRAIGRLEESEDELERALECVRDEEQVRARLLAELAETRAERGRPTEAEACRVEALRIASAYDDRELLARLRRLAHSLAIAVASRRAVTPNPERQSSEPPPRVSEWRVKPEVGKRATPPARRKI
jgi:tetratricopeptide (TPR) repeat protein